MSSVLPLPPREAGAGGDKLGGSAYPRGLRWNKGRGKMVLTQIIKEHKVILLFLLGKIIHTDVSGCEAWRDLGMEGALQALGAS